MNQESKQTDLEIELRTNTVGKEIKFILPSGMYAVCSREQLDKYLKSIVGKPVYIGSKPVGRVLDSWWDEPVAIGIKVSVNKQELKDIGMTDAEE